MTSRVAIRETEGIRTMFSASRPAIPPPCSNPFGAWFSGRRTDLGPGWYGELGHLIFCTLISTTAGTSGSLQQVAAASPPQETAVTTPSVAEITPRPAKSVNESNEPKTSRADSVQVVDGSEHDVPTANDSAKTSTSEKTRRDRSAKANLSPPTEDARQSIDSALPRVKPRKVMPEQAELGTTRVSDGEILRPRYHQIDRTQFRYDGRGFDDWRMATLTELSPQHQYRAAHALMQFAAHGYENETAETLCDIAQRFDWIAVDTEIQRAIVDFVPHLPNEILLRVLRRELQSEIPHRERFALVCATRLGARMVPLTEDVIVFLDSPDLVTRMLALKALRPWSDSDSRLRKLLENGLNSPFVRDRALEALDFSLRLSHVEPSPQLEDPSPSAPQAGETTSWMVVEKLDAEALPSSLHYAPSHLIDPRAFE